MSTDDSPELDLARKLNLIEAMLNADGKDPRAQRLDDRVTFSRLAVARGYIAIENNELWLAFESDAARIRVTDDRVSDIVASIEGHHDLA